MLLVAGDDLRGIRDKALLQVAYDTLCRRSELVDLMAQDIATNILITQQRSRLSIKLRKSKTDQTSQGKWLHLSEPGSAALKKWLLAAGISEGPIFRGIDRGNKISEKLGCGQIARIFKKIANKAQLNCDTIKRISGHSMRVGAAQDLLREGVSLPNIMNRGRWSKTDTVMRYVEQIAPADH
jgi:site-specific recombinase XerD